MRRALARRHKHDIVQSGDFAQLPKPAELATAGRAAKVGGPNSAEPAKPAHSSEQNCGTDELKKAKLDPLRGKKKNLLSYVIFLVVFVNASFNGRTGDMFYQNHFIETALSLRRPRSTNSTVFDNVDRVDRFWQYMQSSFSQGIHDVDWAADNPNAPMVLVTGYRVHQIRGTPVSCSSAFQTGGQSSICVPLYSQAVESTEDYRSIDNLTTWKYTENEEVLGYAFSMTGSFGTYSPAGFEVRAKVGDAAAEEAFWTELQSQEWIGQQTRAVLIEMTVYNPTQVLLCAAKLLFEFTPMGKVIPTYSIRTWKYKPLVDTSSASWWYDIILVVMVVVYAGGELLEMRRHVLSEARRQKERMSALLQTGDTKGVKERKGFAEYFEDRWNFVDLANYTLFGIGIGFEFASRLFVSDAIDLVNALHSPVPTAGSNSTIVMTESEKAYSRSFVSFYQPAWLSSTAYTLLGVNAVLTWLKTLKYLNEFPHLSMLSMTLRNACYPIASFLIMFFIVFMGCSQAFNMTFGPYMEDYSSLGVSMMSLFRALLGEFDYNSMARIDRIIGPLLFLVFMLLVLFVLLNMFIAILAEAYEKAKIEVFGDVYYSQDQHWVGSITFIEYAASSVFWGAEKIGSGTKKVLCGWRNRKSAPMPTDEDEQKKAMVAAALLQAKNHQSVTAAASVVNRQEDKATFSPMDEMGKVRQELAGVGAQLGALARSLKHVKSVQQRHQQHTNGDLVADSDPMVSKNIAELRELLQQILLQDTAHAAAGAIDDNSNHAEVTVPLRDHPPAEPDANNANVDQPAVQAGEGEPETESAIEPASEP